MTIHLYAICWNEMRIIDFFFRHYEAFVDRFVMFDDGSTDGTLDYLRAKANVEVRPFPRADPGSFVLSQQALQNKCWKESRGAADWVIVTAIDEHIHHASLPAYLSACKAAGVTYIPSLGFQMVTNDFPRPDEHLASTRTWGAPDGEYSKLRIFDPDAITESNFAIGGHRSGVEGRCVLPVRDELLLLHYRDLGVAYMRERDPALKERLGPTDRLRTFGHHYSYTDEERARQRAERMMKSVNISGPFYRPWRDHRAPRWWRDPKDLSAYGLPDND